MPTHTSASSALVLSSRLWANSWQRPLKGVLLPWNLFGLGGWFVILIAYTMLTSSVQARVVPQYLRSVPESSYKIHPHHHHHHHHKHHHQQQQPQQQLQHQPERHHYASPQFQTDASLAHSGIWLNLAIPSTRDILNQSPSPGPAKTSLAPQPDLSRLVIHSAQTTSQPATDETLTYDSENKVEEERRLELDLEEHLRQALHRQARQAPNLCVKDETGKTETICQTCSEITNNPEGHHDCCRNIESAFSWCKRLYDFRSRFGG
ncbi:hypothetical protein TCAL_10506 [Tigriopus californicus]|uniref:Uncharacterized protein n=1 Tax=Tigriopus californicus TaxID=6832 RepID=A0A553P4A7_TIGCA|nr:box A-binding factor-like [Tigriopus californicus]TRY72521.1 hypothetical protein TCAL_10506 [Tigriopus californicus]|eukprot:TCALIF_10506-PA protein Name:"Protein of unknown function" AED:0.12 eAED:0.13 QI:0/1/0.66/1/1/1/3/197/262